MKKVLLVVVSALFLCTAMASNADSTKIVVVNIQKILQTSPEAKKIGADLQTKFEPRKNKILAAQKNLQADMDNLHKQITEYREGQGHKTGPVRHGPDTILFVAGCTSYAIKRVIIE